MIETRYQKNNPAIRPFKRGVSIIGVGATPFMKTKDDPELNGIAEGELFGYAAIEAMADAGVTAADVDFFVHGQAGPGWTSNFATPNMHVANWFGMKGKGSLHQSEACCTGYVALEVAANLIASGVYDVVLTGCVEMPHSISCPTQVLTQRRYGTDAIFREVLCSTIPRDYAILQHSAAAFGVEGWLDRYVQENGLSDETVDQVLTRMSINAGIAASRNHLSLTQDSYEDLARKMGMETAEEYLHSRYNENMPKKAYENRLRVAGKFCSETVSSASIRNFGFRPI